ncbi:MAG: hypothetical protein R3B54_10160 [Bdellovibrionota bacterium]
MCTRWVCSVCSHQSLTGVLSGLCAGDARGSTSEPFCPIPVFLLNVQLNEAQAAELNRSQVRASSTQSRQMLQALNEGNWEAEVFNHPRASEIAYGLYRAAKISESQFVTHQFFWAARAEFAGTLRFLPVMNGSGLSPEGSAVFSAPRGLDDSGREAFAREAATLPRSEQYVLQVSTEAAVRNDPRLGMADATFRGFLGTHFKPLEGSGWGLVVPSLSLMQLYLSTRYKDRAMQGIPEFGVAPHDRIIDQIGRHTRVIAVPFPGIAGVEEGDGMYFGKTYAFLHDFYHLDRGSSVVIPEYRVLFPLIFSAMLRNRRDFRNAPGGEYSWVWQDTIDGLLNLESESRHLLTYGPPPSALDCFEYDFGRNSRRSVVATVVLRDMGERPEVWAEQGVDPEAWQRRLQ